MKLSIIIPTYNNAKTIDDLLKSIFQQKFPRSEFEVLIVDGGSSDDTVKISRNYPVKIINNPKRNEEAAKILGLKKIKGEFVCTLDADNILVGNNWVEKIVEPFNDKEIAFSETLYYSYRKTDPIKVKYQVLIGGDDPIAMYLGIYSRWCYLYGDWTGCGHKDEDKGSYLKSKFLDKKRVPPMGANGCTIRTKIARKFIKESFIHSDIIYELVNSGYNCFAKVKTGIIHNQPKFFPNKIRRIKRRLNNEINIKYNYGVTKKDMAKTVLYMCLIAPVLYDMVRGFAKKPTLAWLFHPVACFGELYFHGYYYLKHKITGRA